MFGDHSQQERRQSALKGVETRRINRINKIAAANKDKDELSGIRREIAELNQERDKLKMEIELNNLSVKLSDRILLREHQIVAASIEWTNCCGIYFLIKNDRVVYVGQSVSIFGRVSTHGKQKDFDRIAWVPCNKDDLNQMESLYIHVLSPPLNGNAWHVGEKLAPIPLRELFKRKKHDHRGSV